MMKRDRTAGLNTFAGFLRTCLVIMTAILISLLNPWIVEAEQLTLAPAYNRFRYEEDYPYLRDPSRRTYL